MQFRRHVSGLAAIVGATLLALAGVASAATTTTYQALVETRADGAAPYEVYLASFATLNDLINANVGAPTGFTQLAISPDYQIAEFTGTTTVTGGGGPGGVPEPATWALMLIGFGGLGAAIRRSRQKAAATA